MTEQSIRDDLAEAMIGVKSADGMAWPIFGDFEDDRADTLVLADAILASPVIRHIQAEAIRQAAEALNNEFQDIPAWIEAYREGVRTDEWMKGGVRMVMSVTEVLRNRADRIEAGDRG